MKKQLINFAQTAVTLLCLSGILLMTNCHGPMGLAAQDLPSNNGKQEVVNPASPDEPDEIIVFCGNPGVGKSSLCNSIFQKKAFESGISIGTGLTQKKQEYIYENRKYIDTPGLSDVNLRKQAAEEIEKALKENNNYKIIFVATLEAGRIKSDDLVTINTVCEAIKVPFEYGIIFNKVTNPVIKKISETGLESYLTPLHKQPLSTIIIKFEGEMQDADNEYLSANSENRTKLLSFISSLKSNMILANNVQHIDVEAYQKQVQEMEVKLKELSELLIKVKEERILNQKLAEQQRIEFEQRMGNLKLMEQTKQAEIVRIKTVEIRQAEIEKENQRLAQEVRSTQDYYQNKLQVFENAKREAEALAARQSESLKKLQEEKLVQERAYKKPQEESKAKLAKQEEKLPQETKQISKVIPKLAGNQEELDEAIKVAPHGEAIVKALVSNSTSFEPDGDEFTETDMAVLVNHPGFRQLTSIHLGDQKLSAESLKILARNLKGLTNLQVLYLYNNQIAYAGMQALTRNLKGLTNLKELRLDNNQIRHAHMQVLAPHFKGLTNLQKLYLNANQIGDAGIQALAPNLKELTNLKHLFLSHNQIGDAGMQALAPNLKGLKNLKKLYLESNQIGDAGMQALAPNLKGLTNLQELYLSYNPIGDAGMQALAPNLKGLTNLKNLSLYNNQIGYAGIQALAPNLKGLTNLRCLALHYNQIGGAAMQVLAPNLKGLTNLQKLSLNINQIGDAGMQALAPNLEELTNLKNLWLDDNQIGDEGAKVLGQHLQAVKGRYIDLGHLKK
jgi:Leucine-rich repeat (LRR) protein/GTP-binding protein EngB required for normal cell division